tara:strand:+ start:473 stop:640 length:168 start_codon:yes stop_codon:yes gene_type:complete
MKTFLIYIDPGSGFLILQILISFIISVGIFFKKIKHFIQSILLKLKDRYKNKKAK